MKVDRGCETGWHAGTGEEGALVQANVINLEFPSDYD